MLEREPGVFGNHGNNVFTKEVHTGVYAATLIVLLLFLETDDSLSIIKQDRAIVARIVGFNHRHRHQSLVRLVKTMKFRQVYRAERISIGNQKRIAAYEPLGISDCAPGPKRVLLFGDDEIAWPGFSAIMVPDYLRHVPGAENKSTKTETGKKLYQYVQKGPLVYPSHRFRTITDNCPKAAAHSAAQYDHVNVAQFALGRSPDVHKLLFDCPESRNEKEHGETFQGLS